MIVKIIIALIVIYAIYSLFFKHQNEINTKENEQKNFVECKKCGVFVDESSLKNGLCESCQKERQ